MINPSTTVSVGCNVTAGGNVKPSVPAPIRLNKMPWFHGKISREDAEDLLHPSKNKHHKEQDGLFLVRESTNFVGDYTLCVSFQGKVEHYRVICNRNKMHKCLTIDEDEYFENLNALVEHYREDADGLCTRLTEEVPNKQHGQNNGTSNTPATTVDKAIHEGEVQAFKDAGWVIDDAEIQYCEKIGKGEFGDVMLGVYKGERVAVKIMKDIAAKKTSQFLSEAAVMTSLQHENLVCLKGIILECESMKIVTEFMTKGSLLEYLRSRGRQYVTRSYQMKFAYDTCKGMAYLESKNIIHRDLAARNVLISENDDAKVSDFGLAIHDKTSLESGKLPIKWTAPEALRHHQFTSKSDMWSFGVLLWEIYSFGRVPYPRIPIADVVKYVEKNCKMEAPEGCPPTIYDIMLQAWDLDAKRRPNFQEVVLTLEKLQEDLTNGMIEPEAVSGRP